MALINWNDTFSVNVAEIDRQHQKLVSMINELSDAMKLGKGKDVLGKIINSLINYTVDHFKIEERYFDRYKYSETNSHKMEHAVFVEKVSEFKNGYETGKLSLSIEVMNFLSTWLQTHIKDTDKKYSQFFNEKGLK
jgi:hemerythrin